jgi:hypothetical protein
MRAFMERKVQTAVLFDAGLQVFVMSLRTRVTNDALEFLSGVEKQWES